MKTIGWWLAAALLAVLPVRAAETGFDFEDGSVGNGRFDKRYASVVAKDPLAGKSSLQINTLTDSGMWNVAWATPKGALEPGKVYHISFKAKMLEKRQGYDQAYLLFLFRPLSANHPRQDAGMVQIEAVGKTQDIAFRLNVPETPDDYALQIHTYFGLLALVDDIKIVPANDEFIAAPSAREGEVAAAPLPENLPTGAGEIKIDPPNRKNQKVFNAADFGVSPDSPDNGEALQNAISAVRRQTPCKLVLNPGVYRIGGEKTITFDAINDFEFDGQGATLLFHRPEGRGPLVGILHNMKTEYRNFVIDWDWEKDPIASVVKVESVSEDGQVAALRRLDGDAFARQASFRVAEISRFNPETGMPEPVNGVHLTFEFFKGGSAAPACKFPEPNLVELTAKSAGAFKDIKPGEIYRMRHYTYDMNGIGLTLNRHLTLENVHIASAPGMGILVSGAQHHWQFLNCKVAPPEGKNRPLSTATDAMHVAQSAGDFLMRGCEISHSADDAMNVHDLGGYAIRLDERRIRFTNLNNHPGNYYQKGDKLEFRNDDFSPAGFTGTIAEVKRISQPVCEITFAEGEKVPEPALNGFVIYNRRLGTKNVVFRDNYIHHFPRALLLAIDDATIENNRIEYGNACGIKIDSGYTFNVWSEGYGAKNIVIRGNTFLRANERGRYPNEARPDIYINSYMGSDPSLVKTSYPTIQNIWIDGNTFIDSTGAPIFMRTAGDVVVSGNRFVNTADVPVKEANRGVVGLGESQRVWILNNVWESNRADVKAGVLVHRDTVKDLVMAGNRAVATRATE